jgi:hypothetical protein
MSNPQEPVAPSVAIFGGLTSSLRKMPFVVSSLQDFEASLLLLSDGRWPATIMTLWSASEKMMRAAVCQRGSPQQVADAKGNKVSAFEVQRMFELVHGELSSELRSRGHNLRKLRNRIAHDGASPEDDFECLHAFFRGGVQFYEATIKAALKSSITSLLSKQGEWFWAIHNNTRKGVFSFKENSSDPELRYGIFYLQSAARKALLAKSIHQSLHPIIGYVGTYLIESDNQHHILSASKTKAYRSVMKTCEELGISCCPTWVSKAEDKTGFLKTDLVIPCPICEGDGVIGYRVSSADNDIPEFDRLEIFCCLDELCIIAGLPVNSVKFNTVFFEKFLTEDVKKFLSCEEIDHPHLSPYSGSHY